MLSPFPLQPLCACVSTRRCCCVRPRAWPQRWCSHVNWSPASNVHVDTGHAQLSRAACECMWCCHSPFDSSTGADVQCVATQGMHTRAMMCCSQCSTHSPCVVTVAVQFDTTHGDTSRVQWRRWKWVAHSCAPREWVRNGHSGTMQCSTALCA